MRLPGAVSVVDGHLGDLIEAANRNHHRRRLARAGWARAYAQRNTPWAAGAPPARDGNAMEVLIDGGSALPAVADAIRNARSSVHVAGWAISPDFALQRSSGRVTLRDALADAAARADVRVLVWGGAPLPVMHPTRAESARSLNDLTRGTAIRGALDSKNRPMHCHHEKLVIVDGRIAFVGGIDLTTVGGDRFDLPPHPHRNALGWHDAAAKLSGPVVADVAAHFAMRWEATTGEHLVHGVTPAAAGSTRVQVVRTVPEHLYPPLPHGDFSVLEVYLARLGQARKLIYLENQFLWSTEIVGVLRKKLASPPHDDFRVCIVLPRKPNNGSDDTRGQLGVLQEADAQHRLLVATIGERGSAEPSVYVHAKIGIIDDTWLTLGSANLNEHSLFNDTEVNVLTDDAGLACSTRERLWSEHLGEDCHGRDPVAVLEEKWRPLLARDGGVDGILRPLPRVSRRSARLLGPLKGLAVDG